MSAERCPRHALKLAQHGKCVLCLHEARTRRQLATAVIGAGVLAGAIFGALVRTAEAPARTAEAHLPARAAAIQLDGQEPRRAASAGAQRGARTDIAPAPQHDTPNAEDQVLGTAEAGRAPPPGLFRAPEPPRASLDAVAWQPDDPRDWDPR